MNFARASNRFLSHVRRYAISIVSGVNQRFGRLTEPAPIFNVERVDSADDCLFLVLIRGDSSDSWFNLFSNAVD